MCDTCGCGDHEIVPVELEHRLLAHNDEVAAHNRAHFAGWGTVAVNLMGSPGSGKTALLEATAALGIGRLAAVSGDLATDHDASRLSRVGIPARSITTGSACHLDASMVHHALHDEDLAEAVRRSAFFFIENVGNLVCPAIYDLGQRANVVVLSVTEGEDKPLKYPVIFDRADLVVLTKIDLLPHLPGFSLDALRAGLARVMPEPRLILVSALASEGLEEWKQWLESLRSRPVTPAAGSRDRARGGEELPASGSHDREPWHATHGATKGTALPGADAVVGTSGAARVRPGATADADAHGGD